MELVEDLHHAFDDGVHVGVGFWELQKNELYASPAAVYSSICAMLSRMSSSSTSDDLLIGSGSALEECCL